MQKKFQKYEVTVKKIKKREDQYYERMLTEQTFKKCLKGLCLNKFELFKM